MLSTALFRAGRGTGVHTFGRLKPALTFDGSGRPVPLSVPDPVAFAGLATRSGHWEFEDHEIEAFPELSIHLDLGQRMLSQLA